MCNLESFKKMIIYIIYSETNVVKNVVRDVANICGQAHLLLIQFIYFISLFYRKREIKYKTEGLDLNEIILFVFRLSLRSQLTLRSEPRK